MLAGFFVFYVALFALIASAELKQTFTFELENQERSCILRSCYRGNFSTYQTITELTKESRTKLLHTVVEHKTTRK